VDARWAHTAVQGVTWWTEDSARQRSLFDYRRGTRSKSSHWNCFNGWDSSVANADSGSKNLLRRLSIFPVAIVLREHAGNFRVKLDRQIIIVNRGSSVLLANQVFKSMLSVDL